MGKAADAEPTYYYVFVTAYRDGLIPEHLAQAVKSDRGLVQLVVIAPEKMWILPAGLVLIGILHAIAYRIVRPALTGRRWWRKGLAFGALAWLLMVPWFEFYLPWNVMHEPWPLVLLEGLLWLATLLSVGLAIAAVQEWRSG